MKRRAQKRQSTSCCGIEPPGVQHIIRPGKRTTGSSHVIDATAVLFPGPPEQETLLDNEHRHRGHHDPPILLALGMAGELAPVMAGERASTFFNLAIAIPALLLALALVAKRLPDPDKSPTWLPVFHGR